MTDAYRYHVRADRRAVDREVPDLLPLSDQSASSLAKHLIASGSAPSAQVKRQEEQQRVRKALDRLAPNDRQVLVLIFLEQLSTADVATIVGISEAGVRHRMRRALEQMVELLGDRDSD